MISPITHLSFLCTYLHSLINLHAWFIVRKPRMIVSKVNCYNFILEKVLSINESASCMDYEFTRANHILSKLDSSGHNFCWRWKNIITLTNNIQYCCILLSERFWIILILFVDSRSFSIHYISGLFSAILQSSARLFSLPIDQLKFHYKVLDDEEQLETLQSSTVCHKHTFRPVEYVYI